MLIILAEHLHAHVVNLLADFKHHAVLMMMVCHLLDHRHLAMVELLGHHVHVEETILGGNTHTHIHVNFINNPPRLVTNEGDFIL